MTETSAAEEQCPDCPHPFPPHIVVAIFESPLDGGLLFCQDPSCGCVNVWGVPQARRPAPAMPPQHVVDQFRAAAHDADLRQARLAQRQSTPFTPGTS
jgi:hypothetical protein